MFSLSVHVLLGLVIDMMPDNQLSLIQLPRPLLPPKDLPFDPLVSQHRGGVAIGDASLGLDMQTWTLSIESGTLVLRDSFIYESVLVTAAGVSECSLAFDQNMSPVAAYEQAGVAKLYYYDSVLAAFTTLSVVDAKYARTITDDIRFAPNVSNLNDVLFFYILNHELCVRVQRERFLISHVLKNVGDFILQHVGMNDRLRLQMNLIGG